MIHYLKEIDESKNLIYNIEDYIEEDLNILPDGSVIYGGAVRDFYAFDEIMGDIDLIVKSNMDAVKLKDTLAEHGWSRQNSLIVGYEETPFKVAHTLKRDSRQIQIIILKASKSKPMSFIDLVRQVDLACCGMFALYKGSVYTVLPNALNDCQDRILDLSPYYRKGVTKKLIERINKFMSRGWTLSDSLIKLLKTDKEWKESGSPKSLLFKKAVKEYANGLKWINFS